MSTKAHYTGPGEGVRHAMIDGDHIVKADPAATGGGYEVFEIEAPRVPAAPQHSSPWAATLCLLEGTLTMYVGQQAYELVPGATITVPAEVPCSFAVTSESARFLAITSGAGAGKFFADFAASVPLDRPIEELLPVVLAVTRRHSVAIIEPVRG